MELVPRREIFAESAVQRIKGIYYKQLNKLSPYYTQMANIGILESKKTKAAWRQTCNVTSLAMTLAGLGIGPTDFRGNQDLLLHIAQNLDPEDFQRYGDLSAARFPDFLQFVVIYVKYVQKHGDGTPALTVPPGEKKNVRLQKNRVIQARGRALGVIADNLKWFNQIAILFGANATPRNYVASRGSTKLERRKFSKKWIEIYEAWKFYSQLVNKKKLEIRKLSKRLANKKLEKSERERLVTEINLLEQELTLTKAKQKKEERETRLKNQVDDYMIWAYLNVLPLLEEGKQVVVNRKGHYVRLQDITDAHILVDDPFQPGKDVEIPWKLAYQRMFFRSFVVVAKD